MSDLGALMVAIGIFLCGAFVRIGCKDIAIAILCTSGVVEDDEEENEEDE